MFVDRVTIRAEAGKGGDGCLSVRREKFVPKGGPDGGDGGEGGSVIIVAQAGVDSLAGLGQRKFWRAESGGRGGSSNCHGASGDDLVIRVPPGTQVIDAEREFVLKDLAAEGESVCAARGGKGGKGNLRFKSSTNRTPRQWTRGGEGEARNLVLELKLIADVGLLGKPNAGKSTLLSRMSHARPKIADYPFTTKIPNLGIVQIDFDRQFVMADIPGLIEGAHTGAGLGLEFLRHIERTRVLIHLVEPAPMDGTEPLENYRAIRRELEQYNIDLTDRPELIVVTKSDLPEAEEIRDQLASELGQPTLLISAVTGAGLDHIRRQVADMLDEVKTR